MIDQHAFRRDKYSPKSSVGLEETVTSAVALQELDNPVKPRAQLGQPSLYGPPGQQYRNGQDNDRGHK